MISKITSYTGTADAADLKSLRFDREYIEKKEGNKRWQEPTGGWVVEAVFDVAGEDVPVSTVVNAAQISSLTLAQVVAAAVAKLTAQLEL